MTRRQSERVALTASTLIIAGILWFWILQVLDVLALLTLAQGQ